jgi:hypothetical protein
MRYQHYKTAFEVIQRLLINFNIFIESAKYKKSILKLLTIIGIDVIIKNCSLCILQYLFPVIIPH